MPPSIEDLREPPLLEAASSIPPPVAPPPPPVAVLRTGAGAGAGAGVITEETLLKARAGGSTGEGTFFAEQSTTDEESPNKKIEAILRDIDNVTNPILKYNFAIESAHKVFFIFEEQVQKMCDAAGVEKKKYGKGENRKVAILDKFKRMFSKKVLNQQKTDKQNFLNNVLNAAKSKVQEVIKKMWPDGVPENVEKFKEDFDKAVGEGSNEIQGFYELGVREYEKRTKKLIDNFGVFKQIKNAAMEVNKIKQVVKKEEK